MWGMDTLGSAPRAGSLPTSLDEYSAYIRQFPGAAPGGSGYTGVAPGDAQGFQQLQQLGQEFAMRGGQSPNIRMSGGYGNLPSVQGLQKAVAARGSRGGSVNNSVLDTIPGGTRAHLGYQLGQEMLQGSKLGQMRDLYDPSQISAPPTDPRSTALMRAGIGEDVTDLQSQRGADRYFSMGEKSVRADQATNALEQLVARYLQPAQVQAGQRGQEANLEALTGAAELESQQQTGQGDQMIDLLNSFTGAGGDLEDPRIAGLLNALLSRFGGAGGGGGVPNAPGGGGGY
jgi:hypothetical protein